MMRVPPRLGLEGLRGVAIVREAARLVPCCGCHLDHRTPDLPDVSVFVPTSPSQRHIRIRSSPRTLSCANFTSSDLQGLHFAHAHEPQQPRRDDVSVAPDTYANAFWPALTCSVYYRDRLGPKHRI
jgi:hypothetical protein